MGEVLLRLLARMGQALTLTDLGRIASCVGDLPAAGRALHTALQQHRELDHRVGQSMTLLYLGAMHRRAGDLPAAGQALGDALTLNRGIGNRSGEATVLNE